MICLWCCPSVTFFSVVSILRSTFVGLIEIVHFKLPNYPSCYAGNASLMAAFDVSPQMLTCGNSICQMCYYPTLSHPLWQCPFQDELFDSVHRVFSSNEKLAHHILGTSAYFKTGSIFTSYCNYVF